MREKRFATPFTTTLDEPVTNHIERCGRLIAQAGMTAVLNSNVSYADRSQKVAADNRTLQRIQETAF